MLSSVALIKQPKEIIGDFLLSVLRSPYYYNLMRADMSGVAITRVTLTKLNASLIPIPPFEEQRAIVEKVNALMGLCDGLEKEIEQSTTQVEQLMQSYLKEVFEPKEKEVERV
jgi:type I restriction enzyme S subunit